MPTYDLIRRASEYLDALASGYDIDIKRVKNELPYFIEVYLKFKENLELLKEIKEEMEEKRFDAPYFGITLTSAEFEGKLGYSDIENQKDISKHKRFFMADLLYKKNLFDRVKSAIASHNIALGHLEEFIGIECEKCGKVIKSKEALAVIEESLPKPGFICPKCGNEKGKIKENKHGIYRLELLPLLPYGGEVMKEIAALTQTEKAAYRELNLALKERKKKKLKSAMVFFKVKENEKWVNKKELFEVDQEKHFETILKEKYGKVKIEKIRFYHERTTLISGKYNRHALALAYTKLLKGKREEILNYLMDKDVDLKKLKEYEELKRKLSSYPLEYYISNRDEIDRIEAEMVKKGFMDEKGNLSKEIEEAIKKRKKISEKYLIKLPLAVFAWDLFKFLMIKPYRERRYSSVIPGLQPIPEDEQLKSVICILEEKEVTEFAGRFIDNEIKTITNACEMVARKFFIEDILKDYLKATSSRAVGATTLYLYSDLKLEEAIRVIYAEENEVKEVIRIIMRLGRKEIIPEKKLSEIKDIEETKTSKKALEFLKYVR